MKRRHLLWIVPLVFICGIIFGAILGFRFGVEGSNQLVEMGNKLDNCCMDTLVYAKEANTDCDILITGYMKECYYNDSIKIMS